MEGEKNNDENEASQLELPVTLNDPDSTNLDLFLLVEQQIADNQIILPTFRSKMLKLEMTINQPACLMEDSQVWELLKTVLLELMEGERHTATMSLKLFIEEAREFYRPEDAQHLINQVLLGRIKEIFEATYSFDVSGLRREWKSEHDIDSAFRDAHDKAFRFIPVYGYIGNMLPPCDPQDDEMNFCSAWEVMPDMHQLSLVANLRRYIEARLIETHQRLVTDGVAAHSKPSPHSFVLECLYPELGRAPYSFLGPDVRRRRTNSDTVRILWHSMDKPDRSTVASPAAGASFQCSPPSMVHHFAPLLMPGPRRRQSFHAAPLHSMISPQDIPAQPQLMEAKASFIYGSTSWGQWTDFIDPRTWGSETIQNILANLEEPGTIKLGMGVFDIGNGKVVKFGKKVTIREALAMEFVRRSTDIPVPKVHKVFCLNGVTYIVMDLIPAESLRVQVDHMTDDELDTVAAQLAYFVKELRQLEFGRPMGSWPCGPYDCIRFDPPPLREFQFVEEFHGYWVRRLEDKYRFSHIPPALREPGEASTAVLSHGDLSMQNILVRGSKIVGIIDWETLGWYPDFWEEMSAFRGSWGRWPKKMSAALGGHTETSQDYTVVLNEIFTIL